MRAEFDVQLADRWIGFHDRLFFASVSWAPFHSRSLSLVKNHARVHSREEYKNAVKASEILFKKGQEAVEGLIEEPVEELVGV